MEFDENNEFEEQEDNAVEIYSKWAIFGFSIIPSPLFGGVLLMINLQAAGYKKAMYGVLAFVVLYIFGTDMLINRFYPVPKVINPNIIDKNLLILAGISIGVNIIGGAILSFYFFKKYFPDEDYFPKSILTPLLIAFVLLLMTRFFGI